MSLVSSVLLVRASISLQLPTSCLRMHCLLQNPRCDYQYTSAPSLCSRRDSVSIAFARCSPAALIVFSCVQ